MNLTSTISELLGKKLFTIAGAPVTIKKVLVFLILLILTYIASKWIRDILNSALKKRGVEKKERYPLLKLTHYTIIILGVYIAFNSVGIPLTGLLAAAGVVGIVLGFGLQSITSNLVSGVLLLGEGTLKVGDLVQVGDQLGEVTDTGIRATTVKTFDNYHVLVPNEEFFSKPFINYSFHDKKIRIDVPIGVAYGSNVEKVREILLNIASGNEKVLDQPEPLVFFKEHGDSSLNFELKCWIPTPFNRKKTKSELNFEINKKFREENIEIPFPQRDVWLKEEKDE
ncbi:mechanosensitive ion channel protein MscS [archaeon SCG-AAA382B04]|nr:mechanosensitive ion channel protein MscS [archaeon SCG-AAA382B04]